MRHSSSTNTDNGYQKVLITVGVMVGAVAIAFIIAKIVDYCYDHTIATRDDASDISEHTRNLIRARLVVAQLQKKVQKNEDNDLERHRKVLRVWSEKGKLSRKIADQRRSEEQKKETAKRHELMVNLDGAMDDSKLKASLEHAAASLLVVSEADSVKRSPGVRRLRRTVLGLGPEAPEQAGSRTRTPKVSIVVTEAPDDGLQSVDSREGSTPNSSESEPVPEMHRPQVEPEKADGVPVQTEGDTTSVASEGKNLPAEKAEAQIPPVENILISEETFIDQSCDRTAVPLTTENHQIPITDEAEKNVKELQTSRDQPSATSDIIQVTAAKIEETKTGADANKSVKKRDTGTSRPASRPVTPISRQGLPMVLPTGVTSRTDDRFRRAHSAKNATVNQTEFNRSATAHARDKPRPKSQQGVPKTTSFKTLAAVYRNTTGLQVHRPVTAKKMSNNDSDDIARPSQSSEKTNQRLSDRGKSAKSR
ncbi:hypothetical protein C0Q70_18902 [Pomacea canaliculata]|uniref:Uncharacterized protein n=1 Tax=Pomacea canaliculata TaxID=400727 RepID=A0A2T7NHT7_POMCA|nr:hypothetical protein C0Q70_18902 [Pomacea canaliculata]